MLALNRRLPLALQLAKEQSNLLGLLLFLQRSCREGIEIAQPLLVVLLVLFGNTKPLIRSAGTAIIVELPLYRCSVTIATIHTADKVPNKPRLSREVHLS